VKKGFSNMNINNVKKAVLTAVLCGSSAWLMAQYATPGQGTTPGSSSSSTSSRYGSMNSTNNESGQPMKINKASELIGCTVKDPQGERLGKIRDVVIDFQNDRVAYAVLGSESGILSAEKLHAVPLRAFQPSDDGTYLILNTDKDKLAHAEGFDKNNWPSVTNPSWGAQPFWEENSGSSSTLQQTPSKSEKHRMNKSDSSSETTKP
jgi:sporulation protein YlmC with PRC-barrel domain